MVEQIKKIFNKHVIIGGIILAGLLCALVLILQIGVFPYVTILTGQKAKVVVTPYAGVDNDEKEIEPTATYPAESLPGVVALGMTVKVSGTGNEGLRMRSGAGTDQSVLFLANEDEYFTIIDGPVIKDSLIWWRIQGVENGQKTGWSVQDYLAAVQP